MELHHLRHFMAVAEELNFGRAAQRLGMAQPPLSQSIKRLEEELGVLLFQRTSRRVEMTPAGRAFYEETKLALLQVDRAQLKARRAGAGDIGQLTVGFQTPALFHVMPRILKKFGAIAPDVEIRFEELSREQQIVGLLSGAIDLGFTCGPQTSFPEVENHFLHNMENAAAIPSSWPLARRHPLHLRDLADQPLILVPRDRHPQYYDEFMAACHRAGFSPRIAHQATQTMTALTLVSAGLGIGLTDGTADNFAVKGVTLRPIVDGPTDIPALGIFAAWVTSAISPALEKLLACIRSSATPGHRPLHDTNRATLGVVMNARSHIRR